MTKEQYCKACDINSKLDDVMKQMGRINRLLDRVKEVTKKNSDIIDIQICEGWISTPNASVSSERFRQFLLSELSILNHDKENLDKSFEEI